MPEETKKTHEVDNSQPKPTNPEVETAEIIKSLKSQVETLTKKNEELGEAKAKYYDAVLNGGLDQQVPEPTHRSVEEIRKDLINSFADDKEVTNLDYCTLVLELDNEVRRTTGESVFLPKGHNVTPTQDEYATADRFHDMLAEAIEASGGSPVSFNAELEKRVKKPNTLKAKK